MKRAAWLLQAHRDAPVRGALDEIELPSEADWRLVPQKAVKPGLPLYLLIWQYFRSLDTRAKVCNSR
jgi:hypothetical protein